MAVKTSWSSGDVLTAADLTDTFAAKMGKNAPVVLTGNTTLTQAAHGDRALLLIPSITITVPANATQAISVGTAIVLKSVTGGSNTITFASGVGVHGPSGYITGSSLTLPANQSATIIKYDTNDWIWTAFSGAGFLTAGDVSGTTGSPSIYTTGIYTVYDFAGSGSITLSASGYAEYLVCGGGGSGSPGQNGCGAQIRTDWALLASGAHTVTVGAGGTSSYGYGGVSGLGGIIAGGGNNVGNLGSQMTPSLPTGTNSSITGSAIEYCRAANGGTGTTPGSGAYNLATAPNGRVIVRVLT